MVFVNLACPFDDVTSVHKLRADNCPLNECLSICACLLPFFVVLEVKIRVSRVFFKIKVATALHR